MGLQAGQQRPAVGLLGKAVLVVDLRGGGRRGGDEERVHSLQQVPHSPGVVGQSGPDGGEALLQGGVRGAPVGGVLLHRPQVPAEQSVLGRDAGQPLGGAAAAHRRAGNLVRDGVTAEVIDALLS